MKLPYKSPNPNSGVLTYELLGDAIILQFKRGNYRYLYNAVSPGPAHVASMRRLATQGKGLTTYVSQHVHDKYARRLPL